MKLNCISCSLSSIAIFVNESQSDDQINCFFCTELLSHNSVPIKMHVFIRGKLSQRNIKLNKLLSWKAYVRQQAKIFAIFFNGLTSHSILQPIKFSAWNTSDLFALYRLNGIRIMEKKYVIIRTYHLSVIPGKWIWYDAETLTVAFPIVTETRRNDKAHINITVGALIGLWEEEKRKNTCTHTEQASEFSVIFTSLFASNYVCCPCALCTAAKWTDWICDNNK